MGTWCGFRTIPPPLVAFPIALILWLQQSVAADTALSLADALRFARAHRPDVVAAGARVREARALRRLAARPPNPILDLSTVSEDNSRRLSVAQSLAPIVRLPSEVQQASALVDAARADSLQRVANLDRDVTRAFMRVHAAARRVEFLSDLVRLSDSLSRLAARRSDAGEISELDREQFSLEASRTRIQLSRATELHAAQQAELVRHLGGTWTTPPRTAGTPTTTLMDTDPASIDVESTPEAQRVRALERSARAATRAASLGRIPIPGLFLQRDWTTVPGGLTLNRVGVSLPLPLFQQGIEQRAAAAERERATAAAAHEAILELTRQLAASRARVMESRRRFVLASDTLLTGVARVRSGAIRLYDAGRTTVLQVIEALRAERDAQLVALDEFLALQEALADYAALAGRQGGSSS